KDMLWPWIALLFASAGAFVVAGLKVPFFAFFGPDRGLRPKEAPASMLIAMGAAAALSVGIGVLPSSFHAILPYPVEYEAYTLEHLLTQLQLLAFAALAFALALRFGLYPTERRATSIDLDWLFRVPVWIVLRG